MYDQTASEFINIKNWMLEFEVNAGELANNLAMSYHVYMLTNGKISLPPDEADEWLAAHAVKMGYSEIDNEKLDLILAHEAAIISAIDRNVISVSI